MSFLEDDFKVNHFEWGGVHFVQYILPEVEYSEGSNKLLRFYLLYCNTKEGKTIHRYFEIKKFAETGQTFIIYKDKPDEIGTLGYEITDQKGDLEIEYRALVMTFVSSFAYDSEENCEESIN